MPKVTIDNKKGLYQGTGSGLTVSTTASLTGRTVMSNLVMNSETVTDAGAVSISTPLSLLVCTTGSPAPALANGTSTGQLKHLVCLTASGTTQNVTPVSTSGAYVTIRFTTVGQSAVLMWNGAGWAVLSRSSGAAAGATAVVGLPTLNS
jgi:hypothetical protein